MATAATAAEVTKEESRETQGAEPEEIVPVHNDADSHDDSNDHDYEERTRHTSFTSNRKRRRNEDEVMNEHRTTAMTTYYAVRGATTRQRNKHYFLKQPAIFFSCEDMMKCFLLVKEKFKHESLEDEDDEDGELELECQDFDNFQDALRYVNEPEDEEESDDDESSTRSSLSDEQQEGEDKQGNEEKGDGDGQDRQERDASKVTGEATESSTSLPRKDEASHDKDKPSKEKQEGNDDQGGQPTTKTAEVDTEKGKSVSQLAPEQQNQAQVMATNANSTNSRGPRMTHAMIMQQQQNNQMTPRNNPNNAVASQKGQCFYPLVPLPPPIGQPQHYPPNRYLPQALQPAQARQYQNAQQRSLLPASSSRPKKPVDIETLQKSKLAPTKDFLNAYTDEQVFGIRTNKKLALQIQWDMAQDQYVEDDYVKGGAKSRAHQQFMKIIATSCNLNISKLKWRMVGLLNAEPQLREMMNEIMKSTKKTTTTKTHLKENLKTQRAIQYVLNVQTFIKSLSTTLTKGGTRLKLHQKSIQTVILGMISGDHNITAGEVAKDLGVTEGMVKTVFQMKNDQVLEKSRKPRKDKKVVDESSCPPSPKKRRKQRRGPGRPRKSSSGTVAASTGIAADNAGVAASYTIPNMTTTTMNQNNMYGTTPGGVATTITTANRPTATVGMGLGGRRTLPTAAAANANVTTTNTARPYWIDHQV